MTSTSSTLWSEENQEVWYGDTEQYWIRFSSGHECFSRDWWRLAVLGSFSTLLYLFGYPLGVFAYMHRAHSQLWCRLTMEGTDGVGDVNILVTPQLHQPERLRPDQVIPQLHQPARLGPDQ
eukprot:gene26782-32909_t